MKKYKVLKGGLKSVAQVLIDNFINGIPPLAWETYSKIPDETDINWAKKKIAEYNLKQSPLPIASASIEEIFNDWVNIRVVGEVIAGHIIQAMQTFADQQVALNGEWNRTEDCLPVDGTNIEIWDTMIDAPTIWFDFYNDESKYPFEYWKPASVKPGSNQGPTKVQLIETIAQRDQVIRDQEATISDLTPNSQQ